MSLFKVENISIAFGGVKALNNVSFEVNKGEVSRSLVQMVQVNQRCSMSSVVFINLMKVNIF